MINKEENINNNNNIAQPDGISINNPKVSVIMNCLNGEKYLREAIDSIYAQTYSDWEIIFWDNASTDKSAEIAKNYGSKLRYFKGQATIPLYSARNLALEQARGVYIAFLDTDDVWLPQKLELQIPMFKNNDKIGLVYSDIEIFGDTGGKRKLYGNKPGPSGRIFRQLLRHYTLTIQTVMVSMKTVRSMKSWFDDTLNISGDMDFFLRIAHDWDVKYLPAVTARYREHGNNLSIKYAEDNPAELDYVVNKLSGLYENFRKEYEMEITALRLRGHKGLAINIWKDGRNSEARRLAMQHILNIWPFILLYFSTFFPYKVTDFLKNNILFKR